VGTIQGALVQVLKILQLKCSIGRQVNKNNLTLFPIQFMTYQPLSWRELPSIVEAPTNLMVKLFNAPNWIKSQKPGHK
jgi:hypothetical protein